MTPKATIPVSGKYWHSDAVWRQSRSILMDCSKQNLGPLDGKFERQDQTIDRHKVAWTLFHQSTFSLKCRAQRRHQACIEPLAGHQSLSSTISDTTAKWIRKSCEPIKTVKDATFARMKCLTEIEHVINQTQKWNWKPQFLNILNSFSVFFLSYIHSSDHVKESSASLWNRSTQAKQLPRKLQNTSHGRHGTISQKPETVWELEEETNTGHGASRVLRSPSLQHRNTDFHFHVRKSV